MTPNLHNGVRKKKSIKTTLLVPGVFLMMFLNKRSLWQNTIGELILERVFSSCSASFLKLSIFKSCIIFAFEASSDDVGASVRMLVVHGKEEKRKHTI